MIAGIESVSFDSFTQIARHLDEKSLIRFGQTCKMMNHWVEDFFKRNLIRFTHSEGALDSLIVIRVDRATITNHARFISVELDDPDEKDLCGIMKIVQLSITHPQMPLNVCIPFYRPSSEERSIPCLWIKNSEGERIIYLNPQTPNETDKKIIENIRANASRWTIFKYKRPERIRLDDYLQANEIIDHYLKNQPASKVAAREYRDELTPFALSPHRAV